MTRADQGRRLANLRPIVARIERQGLPSFPQLIEIAALVSLLAGRLARGSGAGRSRRTVELMARLHDASVRQGRDFASLACAEGCHLCCECYVSAPAPHVFAIADHIRDNTNDLAAEIARIEAADRHTRGKDELQRARSRTVCPLLVGGLCSVYPVRPSACRAYSSLSLPACEAAAEDAGVEIPMPPYALKLRAGYDQALWAALHGHGLGEANYELAHAVLVALADPQAEDKWFAGVDVFASVGADTKGMDSLPPGIADQFCNTLWQAANGEPLPDSPFRQAFPEWCR